MTYVLKPWRVPGKELVEILSPVENPRDDGAEHVAGTTLDLRGAEAIIEVGSKQTGEKETGTKQTGIKQTGNETGNKDASPKQTGRADAATQKAAAKAARKEAARKKRASEAAARAWSASAGAGATAEYANLFASARRRIDWGVSAAKARGWLP